MTTLFRRLGRPLQAVPQPPRLPWASLPWPFSSAHPRAPKAVSCSDDVTSAPTGPATVSAASTTSYGRVLVVGSGPYAGCSLYLLTSDQLHALTGAPSRVATTRTP